MTTIEFLRQLRIGGYAIFDFAVTFIFVYLIEAFLSKLFRKIHLSIPRQSRLFLAVPIGILVHILVGTITPLTAWFIDLHGHYGIKIVTLALLIFGLKDIRIIKKEAVK